MAARALVAYRRTDGYDLHYAHDPGDLRDRIDADTPFGGPAPPLSPDVRRALADRDVAVHGRGGPDTAVDPDPFATGVAWDAVVREWLDYRAYDWCFRVAPDWSVTAFLVLFFGFGDRGGADRPATGDGALLALAPGEESDAETYARGWFEGVKSAAADALACGVWTEADARRYLAGRVRSFAGERAVHVP